MKRAFSYLFKNKLQMFIGYFFKISGTIVGLFIPKIMAYILDTVVPAVKITQSYTALVWWGAVMLVCAFADQWCNMFANRRAALASTRAINSLRYDLYRKTMLLSGRQTDRIGIPSLVSRLTSDTYNIHTCFNIVQRMGVRATILTVGGLIMAASLDLVMTLAFIAVLPVVFAIVFYLSRKGIPLYAGVQKTVDDMVRVMREDVSGIRVIKALSKEDWERQRFETANTATVNNELKASGIMAASGPFISLSMNMGLVLVIMTGAYRVYSGAAQPGVVVAFLSYFTIILNAVISVNRLFIIYSKAAASAKRIYEVLDAEDDLPVLPLSADDVAPADASAPACSSDPASDGSEFPAIEFRHVWFRYGSGDGDDGGVGAVDPGDAEKYVLSDISFTVPKGGSLGIIGSTGAGKTTLISLLMRYYDVTKGQILVNGRDIKTYPLPELRGLFGTAFQNNAIFADTIRENISFGRDLSDEAIQNALDAARASAFVSEKENGLEHVAAIKGADFSGGQKQRLYVARALAGKPDIIVLDDAASALDYQTDADIRNHLRAEYSGTTQVIIAQRISSVMKMDSIIVLEEGRISAAGTHRQLLQSSEIYREIAASQLGSLE